MDRHLIGFMQSRTIPGASDVIRSLIETLDLHDRSWVAGVDEQDIDPDTLRSTALIVTAGGDGTIIRVNRLAAPYSIPIVGINMGRVGFMTEVSVESAAERLPQYLSGEVRTEERLMIQAEVTAQSNGETRIVAHALNEAIVRGTLPRLLDVEVTIDGIKLATYRADGVIVSTPTGQHGLRTLRRRACSTAGGGGPADPAAGRSHQSSDWACRAGRLDRRVGGKGWG